MKYARIASLVLTSLISIGAFTLSFTALTDLAAKSGIPVTLAWIWALVIDMTIIVGTVARIALPHSQFATAVLWASAATSVLGNAFHAATYGPVGVAVAAVPPVALIAVTHLTVRLTNSAPRERTVSRPLWMPRGTAPDTDLASTFRQTAHA